MVTQEEREFSESLTDYDTRISQLREWVNLDRKWRDSGQGKKPWSADFELPRVGHSVIVWPGCCTGTVTDYSIKHVNGIYERAVWVLLNNGEYVKCAGMECKDLTTENKKQFEARNADFKKKLVAAGKKVERQRKERRQRVVKGSHLLDEMLATARNMSLVLDEKSSFHKITGTVKGKTVYISIKGGRVDLSGFCVEHAAAVPLTKEEAQARHLGKVRGQLNFTLDDVEVMEAYQMALGELTE